MGKLIDKIKVGMTMKEVRSIIPYKPFLIIADNPMDTKTGHKITPTLDEMDRIKQAEEKEILNKSQDK